MELRQRRLETGLKVKTILECLNISRTTYYFAESGKRELTPEEEAKLNELFESVEKFKGDK